MKAFSDRLREARAAAGLTQEQLGFATDVTKSSVSAWENGREMPSFKVLPALRKALGVSLDALICGDEYAYSGENQANNVLSAKDAKEAALLEKYRDMAPKQRKALLDLINQ